MRPRTAAVLFGFLVALCLAQVAWWVIFQLREARVLQQVAAVLERGDSAAAAELLADGGDLGARARSRILMFASEGAALSVAVLAGVVLFYLAMLRERRTRQAHARFLTGATHELKTPLATLRLGLDSLLDKRTPAPRRAEYLTDMQGAVDRLEHDLHNLLLAAGLREAGNGLHLQTADLAADVAAVVEEFRAPASAAELTLTTELEPSVSARRDGPAFARTVRNLLDNACKFTPRGGHVAVQLRRRGERAELVVRDDGVGVAETERDRIFEPMFRGSRREHVGGTGMGLYIARQLTEAQGGTVSVASSDAEAGSCFTVALPLAEQPS